MEWQGGIPGNNIVFAGSERRRTDGRRGLWHQKHKDPCYFPVGDCIVFGVGGECFHGAGKSPELIYFSASGYDSWFSYDPDDRNVFYASGRAAKNYESAAIRAGSLVDIEC